MNLPFSETKQGFHWASRSHPLQRDSQDPEKTPASQSSGWRPRLLWWVYHHPWFQVSYCNCGTRPFEKARTNGRRICTNFSPLDWAAFKRIFMRSSFFACDVFSSNSSGWSFVTWFLKVVRSEPFWISLWQSVQITGGFGGSFCVFWFGRDVFRNQLFQRPSSSISCRKCFLRKTVV